MNDEADPDRSSPAAASSAASGPPGASGPAGSTPGERGPEQATSVLPILGVPGDALPARVITVGDPRRAERAANLLDDASLLAHRREYAIWVGSHRGVEVAVVSHGVGAAGAGVCFEELCRAGVQRIVRAGTAGGLQPEVGDGDLVVATAGVRDDGLTDGLVPAAFPAVADRAVTAALVAGAPDAHEGIVLTSAVFYPHDVFGSNLATWQRAGVVAVEMEVAALFVIASLHDVAAGAILAIDGNPLATGDAAMAGYDPDRDVVADAVTRMLAIALDAVCAQ